MDTYEDLFQKYKTEVEEGSKGLVDADRGDFLKFMAFYGVIKRYEFELENKSKGVEFK